MKEIRPKNIQLALLADIQAICKNTIGLPITIVDIIISITSLALSLTILVPTYYSASCRVSSNSRGIKGSLGSLLLSPSARGNREDNNEDSILSNAI